MNGIKLVKKSELTLLGAPLFIDGVESVLEPKIEKLKIMSKRLQEIDNHEGLFLLRNCLAMPKLTYFLRTAPCFQKSNVLESFDSVVKETLVSILKV